MRTDDPMSDAYWLEVQDRRVEELEAEVERLRMACEAAYANVKAVHDPDVEGHLGVLLNAEAILLSVIDVRS